MPARGNEKPHVESRVKFMQRNWATAVPQVENMEALNEHLAQPKRRLSSLGLPVGRQQRLRLDRIPETSPGSVRLDHIDIGRL